MLERVRQLGLEVPARRELLFLAIRVDDGRGLRLPGLEQRDLGGLHERFGRSCVAGIHRDADRRGAGSHDGRPT